MLLPGLVCLLLGLAALPTAADIIILKNGRRIVANSVREEGSRVSYETEAGTYALPRSLVAAQLLPWPGLEESFVHLGPGMASVAYAQSLAATEFLVRRYGMHELERLLNRLAEGRPVEAALNSVYRLDYLAGC